jgi:toxin ParE1/3/4
VPGRLPAPKPDVLGYSYHEAAAEEYHRDIEYYRQISPHLGRKFVTEVEAAIARIREFPEGHSPVARGLRRCPIRRFRHAIIYEVRKTEIFIWAVMHTSREPNYWKNRVEKGPPEPEKL